jgi:glycosyltransferase involved in cell wall biosynthesis
MRLMLLTSAMAAGGAERVASTLLNAWAARGDRVALVQTFSGGGGSFYRLAEDVELVNLADAAPGRGRTLGGRIARLRALRRIVRAWHPDVVVSFLANVNVAAVLATAFGGAPVVISERSDPFARPTPLLLGAGRRLTYPAADALVVQTGEVARKYAASRWPWGTVTVIPNPVPPDTDAVEHRGSADGGPVLLAIGRLSPEKQFDVLIRVFASLSPRYPLWRLRIVGEGPLRGELEAQRDRLRLGSRVELPGRTDSPERECAAADAFALTSAYEGFPNGLLEAMAVGVASVAFDCPCGPREITDHGKAALLAPAGDEAALERALSSLMGDAALRRTLGERGRQSVRERFALPIVLARWDRLFQDLLAERHSPGVAATAA